MKLIVITDCHVVPDGQTAHGLDSSGRLRAAVADINRRHAKVAHLFSGHTHRSCSGFWDGIPFATPGPTHYVTAHHVLAGDGTLLAEHG